MHRRPGRWSAARVSVPNPARLWSRASRSSIVSRIECYSAGGSRGCGFRSVLVMLSTSRSGRSLGWLRHQSFCHQVSGSVQRAFARSLARGRFYARGCASAARLLIAWRSAFSEVFVALLVAHTGFEHLRVLTVSRGRWVACEDCTAEMCPECARARGKF